MPIEYRTPYRSLRIVKLINSKKEVIRKIQEADLDSDDWVNIEGSYPDKESAEEALRTEIECDNDIKASQDNSSYEPEDSDA